MRGHSRTWCGAPEKDKICVYNTGYFVDFVCICWIFSNNHVVVLDGLSFWNHSDRFVRRCLVVDQVCGFNLSVTFDAGR